jgi:hypothetical protein
MPVTNDDRIAAAVLRLEQAERLISEARKIFTYAEKQEKTEVVAEDGLYPGQIKNPEDLECLE